MSKYTEALNKIDDAMNEIVDQPIGKIIRTCKVCCRGIYKSEVHFLDVDSKASCLECGSKKA